MQDRFSSALPLLGFTAALMVAVGIELGVVARFIEVGGLSDESFAALAWSFGVASSGALLAFLHLGRPALSWQVARGIAHSWLSREALLAAGFTGLVGASILLSWQCPQGKALLVLLFATGLAGLAAVWSVGRLYNLEAQITWYGWVSRVGPVVSVVLLATAVWSTWIGAELKWFGVFFLLLLLGGDFTISLLTFRSFWTISKSKHFLVYPHMRLLVIRSHLLRFVFLATAAGLVVSGLGGIVWFPVVAALLAQRFSFYAQAATPTPRAEIADLKARRMEAALRTEQFERR